MNIDKINCSESWKPYLEPFVSTKEFDDIFLQLQTIGKSKKISPAAFNLFRPFRECNYEDLKVVILADGPYNNIRSNKIVADGLAFSCAETGVLEKELEVWYDGVERDLFDGLKLDIDISSDLTGLASQGVLLLNTALSTTAGDKYPHFDIWRPFITYLLKSVINPYPAPLVVICMGDLVKVDIESVSSEHELLMCDHPKTAISGFRRWNHRDVFSKTNEFLLKTRNESIEWVETIKFCETN